MKIAIISSIYKENNDCLKLYFESLLHQSFSNFEIILVDDGATEENLKIISNYQHKFDRLKVIKNETNLGLTRSLNIGILNSDSDYIARLDTDDYCHPDRLKRQLDFLENNKDYCACSCHSKDITFSSHNTSEKKLMNQAIDHHEIFKIAFYKNPIIHSGLFVRHSELKKVGLYNEYFKFSQDYELVCRLLGIGKLYILGETLVYRHISENQISFYRNKTQTWYSVLVRLKMQYLYGFNLVGSFYIFRAFLKIILPKFIFSKLR